MPEVRTDDAVLHVEVDGAGEPVTVLAHGLTNSCRELAPFTSLVAGTKVRFCLRGHGHSSVPDAGYGFADFARDLDAVAEEYGASNAVGTSLGAGAICHLLGEDPARFERIVLLLPTALDQVVGGDGFLRTASILESMPLDRAIDTILSDPGRQGDLIHPARVARILAELFPDSELILLPGEEELIASIPMLVDRVGSFLAGAG